MAPQNNECTELLSFFLRVVNTISKAFASNIQLRELGRRPGFESRLDHCIFSQVHCSFLLTTYEYILSFACFCILYIVPELKPGRFRWPDLT